MDQRPFVSVILCFYNEQRFIKEAIESVRSQTHSHWELFLVDDGSTDHSTLIAKSYASLDPRRIHYLQHEGHLNKGLSASRNRGIRRARGRYIAFIDADDIWHAQKLENQLAIFQANPDASVILEASHYWKTWTETSDTDVVIPIGANEGVYAPPKLMQLLYPLGKGAAPCPSGIIAKKQVFDRHLFEESFRGIYQMYEDQAFLCKLYLNEKVYVSAACNHLYRQRPASLVSSVHESGKYHTVRKFYLEWFAQYLNTHPTSHRIVGRLLRKAMLPYEQPVLHKITSTLPALVKKYVLRILIRFGLVTYKRSW